MSESKRLLVTTMKWRVSGARIQAFDQLGFLDSYCSNLQLALAMQKNTLSAASVFVSEGLFIYIYFLLFEENHQNRISRAGEKNFFNDFALYS